MNLQEKISLTRKIFEQALGLSPAGNIFAAWTGGKDSTVMLHQWMIFLQERGPGVQVRALNLDTGYKFPEVLEFRDEMAWEWGIELTVAGPDSSAMQDLQELSKVECCRRLKVSPLQEAVREHGVRVLLTGIRRDEHPSRENTPDVQEKNDLDYYQVNPIAHWTEMDIWSYIMLKGLPYCSLYDVGYRSLGCKPCTVKGTHMNERSGRDREKEENLDMLRSMGYF
ncbi:phosphoadenosine phosphosulfate reductase family protein [Desulfonatronospira sp. MSAO_Bac3]|uniref:phosphoadenosine phosphosulfate reductase family protein n=1 Tax=Desulfonatronospira sp. MSAO_Bac3 TaxID=2293857 RepID=UPI000FEF8E35|nr:phosphoadenosine phosphosulfate reductase family protein [Desulfonatronospira sp. MSAO_Bac3]RQD76688.1 MAG: phosphoadenosine phosphosulfate reductase [Desulfonatronospira sp. MSAO_Bac3]